MDINEIKKLSPEERIKKLKELEEERKKEQEEANKLIQESIDEIKREELVKQIEVPEQEHVNIDDLFAAESENLEQTVAREPTPEVEEEIGHLYNRLGELKETFQETEYMNAQQRKELNQAEQRLKQIEANYTLTDAVREQVFLSENIAKQMRKYLK